MPTRCAKSGKWGFASGCTPRASIRGGLPPLLPLVDWVAMDIKAPFEEYAVTTGAHASGKAALESAQLILAGGVEHEFRTTVHPSLLPPDSLARLVQSVAELGVRNYVLQEFRAQGCASARLQDAASYLTDSFLHSMAPLFSSFSVRRA